MAEEREITGAVGSTGAPTDVTDVSRRGAGGPAEEKSFERPKGDASFDAVGGGAYTTGGADNDTATIADEAGGERSNSRPEDQFSSGGTDIDADITRH